MRKIIKNITEKKSWIEKVMVFILFTIHYSLFTASAQTQDDARQRQVYAQAERDYQIGRTEQARDSLMLHLNTFQGNLRENALRLIALTYLESFDVKQTERYAGMLLKQNPYYTVSSQDPTEFADIVSRIKAAMTVTVTTASSQAETIEEAPLPVTLITEEMIRDSGARDLRELLTNYVPGIVATENKEPTVVMRGLVSEAQEKILVMLNGHRLNDYSTNVGRLDYSISLSKVKRIEVVRGPASSLYGGSAYAGVMNIITKTGGDIDGLQAGAAVGDHGQLKGSVLFGKSLPYLDIMAWANVYKTDGQKSYYEQNKYNRQMEEWTWRGDITTGVYNHKPAMDFGAVARWKGLTFMHNTHSSNYVVPVDNLFYIPFDYNKFPSINGNKPGIGQTSHHTSLTYDYQKGPWALTAGIDYDASKYMEYYFLGDSATVFPIPFYDEDRFEQVDNVEGNYQYRGWSSSNLTTSLRGSWSYAFAGSHQGTLTLGLQSARFTFSDYQEYEGVYYSRIIASTSDWRNQEQHEKNFSSFLQVKHRWGPVIANVGVRYDHVKRRTGKTNNELSPRMALIFMQPRWGSKLCYSTSFVDRAFKHRCITESYTDPESASPEYSRCWQLTLWGKQLLKGLNAEVTLYHSTAENMVETIAGSDEGMMKSIGMEICADYTLGKLGVHGNASWKRMLEHKAYFEAEEDEIELGDPKFSANTTVSYQLLPTLRLHVNAHYIGRRYLKPQSYPYLYSFYDYPKAPGVLTLDMGASWNWRRLGVNVNIHNILGKEYWQSGKSIIYNLPQQGRWLLVELTYKI